MCVCVYVCVCRTRIPLLAVTGTVSLCGAERGDGAGLPDQPGSTHLRRSIRHGGHAQPEGERSSAADTSPCWKGLMDSEWLDCGGGAVRVLGGGGGRGWGGVGGGGGADTSP